MSNEWARGKLKYKRGWQRVRYAKAVGKGKGGLLLRSARGTEDRAKKDKLARPWQVDAEGP